ncbi:MULTISPECIES: XRE family transcriptional regulator [unclassified Streptomyces]|uniref:XRE family transcriptional regulator n=1 Tax=unclassified Streptomyces TaxID=2593676 RepID=UPI0037FA33A8
MDAVPNHVLTAWMKEQGYSSRELADRINRVVGELTGKTGGLDDSSIRAWRSGRVRCPKSAQRAALELVSGRTALALGFVRRTRTKDEEQPVDRRAFITAAATAAFTGGPAAGTAGPRRVGMADVALVQQRFSDIIASDHLHGGQLRIEMHAATLADEALALQRAGTASQRVRASLYAAAASFRSSAMWAAIDGRRFGDASNHMREAQVLAELSGDPAIKFRIWSHAGTMYRHMGRPVEAAAANDVARGLGLARRDPMFASLGLARHAAIYASAGDRSSVRRSFGHAREAMNRADPGEVRPVWLTAFYDAAEIDSLALSAYSLLGDWATAEAHGHRCLAGLRPHMVRSKAITTVRLARAQLEQREVESAVVTAKSVPADAAAGHPRVAVMLDAFGSRLDLIAPGSGPADEWRAHMVRVKV